MKINFTQAHLDRLTELASDMLFSNKKVKGIMGTELSISQLLHDTTINTLQTMLLSNRKEVSKLEALDDWSLDEQATTKLSFSKKTAELLNLIIGWKKFKAEVDQNNEVIKELELKLKELEMSSMTPAQQIAEIRRQIAERQGTIESSTGDTPVPFSDTTI